MITIGPAGEMKLLAAGVTNNDSEGNSSRYAGRGGLGAVMGSKKVKAIVVDNPEGLPTIIEMINAQYGVNLTVDDVVALGQNVLKVEREFNSRAGFTKADDRLPEFFVKEELEPHKTKFDIKDEELDEVFNF